VGLLVNSILSNKHQPERKRLEKLVKKRHREYRRWSKWWTLIRYGAAIASLIASGAAADLAVNLNAGSTAAGLSQTTQALVTALLALLGGVTTVYASANDAASKRQAARNSRAKIEILETDMTDPQMSSDEIRNRLNEIAEEHYQATK